MEIHAVNPERSGVRRRSSSKTTLEKQLKQAPTVKRSGGGGPCQLNRSEEVWKDKGAFLPEELLFPNTGYDYYRRIAFRILPPFSSGARSDRVKLHRYKHSLGASQRQCSVDC